MRGPGKKFVKGQSGNPGGRPKVSPDLLNVKEVNSEELKRRISKHFRMNEAEINEVIKNPDTISLDLILASTIATSIKNGDIGKAEYLFNRTAGKVKDSVMVEHDTTIREDLKNLTTDELLKLVKEHKAT